MPSTLPGTLVPPLCSPQPGPGQPVLCCAHAIDLPVPGQIGAGLFVPHMGTWPPGCQAGAHGSEVGAVTPGDEPSTSLGALC